MSNRLHLNTASSVDWCYYRGHNPFYWNKEIRREERESNFSTVSGLGRTQSDSLEMEIKSGGDFVVEQQATVCGIHSFLSSLEKRDGMNQIGERGKTETIKGGHQVTE